MVVIDRFPLGAPFWNDGIDLSISGYSTVDGLIHAPYILGLAKKLGKSG